MKMLPGMALAILSGHACAAGRSTLDEIPAPVRSTLIHAYVQHDDRDLYSELFLEPVTIDRLPGAIVTWRSNNGKDVVEEQHRFFLPGNDVGFCSEGLNVLRHAVDGRIVGDEKWRLASPVGWDEQRVPRRSYGAGVSPVDIIGTELCLAHFAGFSDHFQARSESLTQERAREGEARSAAKQARHDADVTALRECLRDQARVARDTESIERKSRELESASDRLAIARGSLDVQRGIIDSYEASASSRNEYNRQVQAYRASAAEHDRQVKAHQRALERHEADVDRLNAACVQDRQFVGSAVHEVCRTNDSEFCEGVKSRR